MTHRQIYNRRLIEIFSSLPNQGVAIVLEFEGVTPDKPNDTSMTTIAFHLRAWSSRTDYHQQ